MKKQLFIIGMAVLAFSCKQDPAIDYALISGKLLNKTDNQVLLSGVNDRSFRKKIEISSDGTFKDTIRGLKGLYQINYNKKRTQIYLESGYDLTINADLEELGKTIEINGKGAVENNFLKARAKKAKELEGAENIYILEQDVFTEKIDTITSSLNQLLENTKEISESFKLAQQKDIKYTYLIKLTNYEFYHGHYAKKRGFKVTPDFLNDLQNVDYNNEEDYANSTAYKTLLGIHYKNKANELGRSENISKDIANLRTFSAIKSETIKNALLNSTIANITRTKNLEEYYTLFMATSTDEKQKKKVEKLYESLKNVQEGKVSPKFENYINYAGGKTSLEELKGKFVYIDVWATWCGPCTREIPFLKEVEKQYHGKNIEFVSISVDKQKDYEKWRTMVKEKELGGIQLFADNDFKSKFIKDYAINGIPKFILIDPSGNIVDANAPRPSNARLITLFDKHEI
jgi:thiol-disulfide isomerase/thioredoxin